MKKRSLLLFLVFCLLVSLFSVTTYASITEDSLTIDAADSMDGATTSCVGGSWTRIGPGGGGAQYYPTVSPNDPNTMLVASDMSQAFITRDGGKNWTQLNLGSAATTSFAFDPKSSNVIYAGTESGSVLRSTDCGTSWKMIYPRPETVTGEKHVGDLAVVDYISSQSDWLGTTVIQGILVDPKNSKTIYLGINDDSDIRIMKSIDNGYSWSEAALVAGYSGISKMYIDTTSTYEARKLFVITNNNVYNVNTSDASVNMLLPADTYYITDGSYGVNPTTGNQSLYFTTDYVYSEGDFATQAFRSTDMGQTWQEMKTGLDADYISGTELAFNCIATCVNDSNIVYISTTEGVNYGYFGIFKSIDGGQTWNWVLKLDSTQNANNKLLGWIETDFSTDWAGAPFNMGVSPSNPNVCYATDWGTTYRTTNGGSSWQELYCKINSDGTYSTNGLDVTTSYDVVFDPFNQKHIVVPYTDIGLMESYDSGKTWKHAMNGIPYKNAYAVVFDPAVPGKAWSAWSKCHDMPKYSYLRQPFNVEKYAGGVFKTVDSLGNWTASNNGMPANSIVTSLVLDPKSPVGNRTLYAAVVGRGVYKSIDDGQTWSAMNLGIEPNGLNTHIYAWQVKLAPNGDIYLLIARTARAGTIGRGANTDVATKGALYKSIDGANNWTKVAMPEGTIFPNDITFDPADPNTMYVTSWPATINGSECNGGLLKTTDGGATWTSILDSALHVFGVAVDKNNPKTIIAATFDSKVLRSDDSGLTWKALKGFDFKYAKNPIFDPYNPGMLYVTTYGSSVWYGPAK